MSTPAFQQGILGHERALLCNVVGAVLEEGRGHRPDPTMRDLGSVSAQSARSDSTGSTRVARKAGK